MPKQKIKGLWWRSDAPDKKLQGEVGYGPTVGAKVDLFGDINGGFPQHKPTKRFALHGLTLNNKPVTLFECFVTKTKRHIPGGVSCVVESNFGIVGTHVAQPSDIQFKAVSVRFTGLRDWTWVSGIEHKYEQEPAKAVFTYKAPADVVVGRFGNLTAKLEFSADISPGPGKQSIEEKCLLKIEAGALAPYSAFEKLFHGFQKFLSFALQRPSYAIEIIGKTDVPRQIIQGRKLYEDHLIIRHLSMREWGREELIPQDTLFTLSELAEPLEDAMGRFFSKRERLQVPIDLYLSTIYHPDQLLRARFLTLAQAIEAYHRVSMPGKYVDDKTYYKGLMKVLLEAIPRELDLGFRSALENKLKYLHEFSLRKRVEALAQKYATVLGKLLGPAENFASTVSELRNQLIHAESSSDPRAEVDWKKQWDLSEKMALLLETCFLDEVGFGESRIKKIVSSRSQRARSVHFGTF
jgi:hypothetical protein